MFARGNLSHGYVNQLLVRTETFKLGALVFFQCKSTCMFLLKDRIKKHINYKPSNHQSPGQNGAELYTLYSIKCINIHAHIPIYFEAQFAPIEALSTCILYGLSQPDLIFQTSRRIVHLQDSVWPHKRFDLRWLPVASPGSCFMDRSSSRSWSSSVYVGWSPQCPRGGARWDRGALRRSLTRGKA